MPNRNSGSRLPKLAEVAPKIATALKNKEWNTNRLNVHHRSVRRPLARFVSRIKIGWKHPVAAETGRASAKKELAKTHAAGGDA